MMVLKIDALNVWLIPMFGNNSMKKIDEDEKDIEIPSEEDENVGAEEQKKKREKKKKSKEERIAERKTIFWTLLVVMAITLGFWLFPKIKGVLSGGLPKNMVEKTTEIKAEEEKPKLKNYVEINL